MEEVELILLVTDFRTTFSLLHYTRCDLLFFYNLLSSMDTMVTLHFVKFLRWKRDTDAYIQYIQPDTYIVTSMCHTYPYTSINK